MPLTQVSPGLLDTQANAQGFRNRIINGDCRVDQRNNGASVTIGGSTVTYTVDRWYAYATQASKFSVQRSTTAPTGFTNSALITSLSAYSIVSGDVFGFVQPIEGFNFADLGWGTANAQTVTLSFVVRSSLTGTFGGSIRNGSSNRSYPFTYTINAANTFEIKTVTIAGDTTGTWATDNSAAAYVTFGLGVGSTYSGTAGAWAGSQLWSATGATSVVGTNGATFYLTGVQLEKGTAATDFERLDYGRQLMQCQRYAIKVGGDTGNNAYIAFGTGGNTTTALLFYYPQTAFRSTPSLSSSASVCIDDTNGTISISSLVLDTNGSSPNFIRLNATATGLTQFRPYFLRTTATTGNIILSAEL